MSSDVICRAPGSGRFPARGVHARALLLLLCTGVMAGPATAQQLQVRDIALSTGFQDSFAGHFKRGRALVGADFDLDGRIDFYIGNPGDESFVVKNTMRPDGRPRFDFVQTLLQGVLAWGASAADYDNDGDYDVFLSVGGNEGAGFDHLFRNQWLEGGQTALHFFNVTEQAGIAGRDRGDGNFRPLPSANGVWADYDGDGDVDLYVSVGYNDRNILWENNGDGTFSDVTAAVGLAGSEETSQHSTFFDADNDGDMDLFENNWIGPNVLWRNLLTETGTAAFEDATADFSPPGQNLRYPLKSFVSAAADFNNDGWQDLIVFQREVDSAPNPGAQELGSPYLAGHALFLNRGGAGFVNVGHQAGLNNPYILELGVMGCQVGDVSGDGVPDVYVGNGGPMTAEPSGSQVDQLYLSESLVGQVPSYRNETVLIDFPAPEPPAPGAPYPPYPYRTHGTAFVDVDGDGTPEIAVANGGPAAQPDIVREPNRLFKITGPTYGWLRVRPIGNATTVSRDAIGTRLAVTVSRNGGDPWTVHQTLYAGSAFSGQNGFELFFGLRNADNIHSLAISWPDGHQQTITEGLEMDTRMVVTRASD